MTAGTLPLGTAISATISNADACYTAGVAIPAYVFISQGVVIAADTVAFNIQNSTGGVLDAFTANIAVSKL